MCFTRSAPVCGLLGLSRALFRISRASCSIDRPFSAARIFSRCFNFSSSFRTVMLAMQSMIAMLAMIAQGLFAPQDRERDTRSDRGGRTRRPPLHKPFALPPALDQNGRLQEVPVSSLSAQSRILFIPLHLHSP